MWNSRCYSLMVLNSLASASSWVGKLSGVRQVVGRSGWRRRRLLILCYHGISLADEHQWNSGLYVSRETFARRLDLLEQHKCAVLPLGEAVERLHRGDLPERAVALTFDDGYFDFLRQAWPLLREHGFPATVYLTTLRCEHNFPIVNLALSYVLWKRRTAVLHGAGVPGLGEATYPLETPAQRADVLTQINQYLQRNPQTLAAKDDIVRTLGRRLDFDYDEMVKARLLTLMNPAEITELASQGVDFQLHTHRHRTPRDPARFLEEVQQNSWRIEKMTGVRPTHFCYPSGVHYPEYLPVLASERVVSATTTKPGIADVTDHPLLLPRFVDTDRITDLKFESWLHGFAPLIRLMS